MIEFVRAKVFLEMKEDTDGDSYRSESSFLDNEMEDFCDVAEWEGVDEEGDEPLEDPHLIRKVSLFH